MLTSVPMTAVVIVRLSSAPSRRDRWSGRALSRLNLRLHGADIDARATFGPGLLLQHPVGLVIGGGVTVGQNCTFMSGVVLGRRHTQNGNDQKQYPTLGDNILLGTGSCILGAIQIGSNSVIGASSLVLNDVPSNCIAVGIPAVSRFTIQGDPEEDVASADR